MRLNLARSGDSAQAAGFGQERPLAPVFSLAERVALHAAPWFASMPMVIRHDIVRHCEVQRLRSGDPVYPPEAPALCGIVSGAAGIRLHGREARPIDYVPAGTWILDPSALAEGPSFLRVEAHGRATVVRLPRDVLRELLRRHPEAAPAMQDLGHTAVRRVAPILEELASLPLKRRLARCVLRLCDSFGRAQPGGMRITLALNQDEIAHMLRASRQRVNHELKSLEAAGALRVAKELFVCEREILEAAS
jgi:CRP/FNR family transcriptional regulator, cyclic AMP receptor protein